MGKEPGSALALLQDYERQGGYNVLHPIVQIEDDLTSPVLKGSVSIRKFDPAAHTYNDFRYANKNDGKYALNGLALRVIASDAGVRWLEQGVVEARERSPDGHVYLRVRSTGAVLQPNGETYLITQHKEIDTADEEDRIRQEKESKYRRENKLAAGAAIPPAARAKIEDDLRRDIIQIRQHLLSLAETKSMLRVIRALLGLKQTYTTAELAQPFVIPRLLYRPDLTNPLALERVRVQGTQAIGELYGQTASGIHGPVEPTGRPLPDDSESAPGATATQQAPTPAGGVPEREASGAAPGKKSSGGDPRGAGTGTGADDTASSKGQSPPEPDAPPSDPYFEDGPHKGERFSEVAETDPGFLRGIAAGHWLKSVRQLAQAWLDHYNPTLG
jgi:hypothetical protein